MKNIKTNEYTIHFIQKNNYNPLLEYINNKNYSKIFVLVDSNTHEHCLPHLLGNIPFNVEVIEVDAGEENKTIETCINLWETLSYLQADRHAIIINLGGGMVTDLGGFVASTYMRGIDFIHIPTSLLAMVDASIGGKTGVDLGNIKNQVGVINTPKQVIIDIDYLNSLPQRELKSGLAEMFKHGLIASEIYWNTMTHLENLSTNDLQNIIFDSVQIKHNIVKQDPKEQNLRKILNFGHTLGHAIESYFLQKVPNNTLLHGEAIAIGMILESYLSVKQSSLNMEDCLHIKETLNHYFDKVYFDEKSILHIIDLMKHDKKNTAGQIRFVLLEKIGHAVTNCTIDENLIWEAFSFYKH